MNYTFSSGTEEQQTLWERAVGLLLHLPEEGLPLDITVSFDDPSEIAQTSFAETTWAYDSVDSTTKVRNDAPGFGNVDEALIAEAARLGLTYDAHQHFNETAVHELGHSAFAALPEASRLAIAALFGAESDDDAELSPPGSEWQDRIIEAIAETFKEAFLPARYRVFPNRTNIKLSYAHYAAFRRIFREGVPEMGGTLEPGETEVPKYSFDLARQGGERNQASFLVAEGELDEIDGGGGFAKTLSTASPAWAGLKVPIGLESFLNIKGVWLRQGLSYIFEWELPESLFDPANYGAPSDVANGMRFILWQKEIPTGFGGATRFLVDISITHQPGASGAALDPKWIVRYFAGDPEKDHQELEVLPPYKLSVTFPIDSFFTNQRICEGDIYRAATFQGFYYAIANSNEITAKELSITHQQLREAVVDPWLPTWPLVASRCPQGTGSPIEVPAGRTRAFGARAGRVPSRGRILGARV